MNIIIDASAAQKGSSLGSAKMTGVGKTDKTSEKTAEQTEQTAKKYDTLDLSESAVSQAAAELVSGSSDGSDSETIDSSELYSYTDEQLSELLTKGEITRLEYNNEMAKRTSSETE